MTDLNFKKLTNSYMVGTNASTGPNACKSTISGKITIQKHVDGLPVTEIGKYAFYGCHKITEVNIEADIVIFHINAFDRCSKLTKINIPSSTEILSKYAISFTTQSVDQSSGTAEIVIGINSKLKVLSAHSIWNRANINIFLCGKTNPSYYEAKWYDGVNNLNIYSPFYNVPFCDQKTKIGIHNECDITKLYAAQTCQHHFNIMSNIKTLFLLFIL